MKFTLSWLKSYLETSASLEEISTSLTALGLEVEGIEDPATTLKPFIVAEVMEAVTHPNADKLRVCKVNNGKEILQIVCGAPNARAGIKVALASIGTVIPTNGLKIKQSKIRDVESNGMLCSATELGIGEDSAGIIELPASATVGDSIVGVLGLDDPIIEIAITPNRADCLGVRGVARDLAAAGLGTLKPLPAPTWSGNGESKITVSIADAGCHEFIGCTISGVKNAESPAWMQQRLKAIGLRPISALVDITNYFSYDLGRPLHVYDVRKLRGNIVVRASKSGESFVALNDKTYTLDDNAVAITDDSGVIGLGGIMGGSTTGCDETTTDVFLECAYFEPLRIARTGRDLQILSDARYRFERGVDAMFVEEGANRAVAMILELCGGNASQLTHAGKSPYTPRQITYRVNRINQFAGFEIAEAEQKRILIALGFTLQGETATPPSWRADVEGEADLAEEILRVYGYDNVPVAALPKPASLNTEYKTAAQSRQPAIRQTLAMRGLMEGCHWSFVSEKQAKLFGWNDAGLKLVNPISADLDTMRPSLLPQLIEAISRNTARSQRNFGLFELGLQFPSLKQQQLIAAGIRVGLAAPKNHFHTERPADVFDAKADAIAAIEATGFDASSLQINTPAPAWYHPGRSGSLMLGKQVIAHFGELHPAVLKTLDAPEHLVAFEVFVENIPLPKKKSSTKPALEISDFQPSLRDFAFVVDEKLAANDLLKAVKGVDKTLIRNVQLFDVYQGKGVEAGKKSLALTVTLQANDRTLSEQDLEDTSKKIIASAAKLGATLRA